MCEGVPKGFGPAKSEEYNILEPLETGHIYWIPTPRKSNPIESGFKAMLYDPQKDINDLEDNMDTIFKNPQWERIDINASPVDSAT